MFILLKFFKWIKIYVLRQSCDMAKSAILIFKIKLQFSLHFHYIVHCISLKVTIFQNPQCYAKSY